MRALVLGCLVPYAAGHASLTQPLSRGEYRRKYGPCPDNGKVGCYEPWSAGGAPGFSPCGISRGEDFTMNAWEDDKMSNAERLQHTLHAGGVLELKVNFNAHHKGHVVFGICPDADLADAYRTGTNSKGGTGPERTDDGFVAAADCNNPSLSAIEKEACQGNHLSPVDIYQPSKDLMDCFMGQGAWANGRDGAGMMERSEDHEHMDPAPIDANHKDRWYLPPRAFDINGQEYYSWPIDDPKNHQATMYYKVPSNLNCKNGKCLLHFFYWTANSCTGEGYSDYFSEAITYKGAKTMMPRTTCTGGKCPTGNVENRPLGEWAMNGDWWHPQQNGQPNSYPKGSCYSNSGGKVDDKPTNLFSRNNPERFWNCANVLQGTGGGSSSGGGGTTTADPCANVVCTPPNTCQTSTCQNGQCVAEFKTEGSPCTTGGAGMCNQGCQLAECRGGNCMCVNRADNTECSGGLCQNGVCNKQNNPTPVNPTPSSPDGSCTPQTSWITGVKTTRYWDCCKPSCTWASNSPDTDKPTTACDINGNPLDRYDTKNICSGGGADGPIAYMCTNQGPWEVDATLAFGFAAANRPCGECYEMEFTSSSLAQSGKRMILQVTNSGGDLAGNMHFDIQLPGGGFGIFNGCAQTDTECYNGQCQFNKPYQNWGQRYGGISSLSECAGLPSELQAGCEFRFGWFENADNPYTQVRRVKCPAEIVERSGSRRTDDDSYCDPTDGSSSGGSSPGSSGGGASPVAPPTNPPVAPVAPTPVDCVATKACSETGCSVSCGGGTKTKTCTCSVTVQPQHGGLACNQVCDAGVTEVSECNTQACPSPANSPECLGAPGDVNDACTPTPQTCTGTPGCCKTGLHCCGNQYWASCQTACGSDSEYLASFAAGKNGEDDSVSLISLVAAIFGGSLCGGFVVFAALRNRSSGSPATSAAASAEMGTTGRQSGSGTGTTSRVKSTYHEQADI